MLTCSKYVCCGKISTENESNERCFISGDESCEQNNLLKKMVADFKTITSRKGNDYYLV